jgi:hypothetical protein
VFSFIKTFSQSGFSIEILAEISFQMFEVVKFEDFQAYQSSIEI